VLDRPVSAMLLLAGVASSTAVAPAKPCAARSLVSHRTALRAGYGESRPAKLGHEPDALGAGQRHWFALSRHDAAAVGPLLMAVRHCDAAGPRRVGSFCRTHPPNRGGRARCCLACFSPWRYWWNGDTRRRAHCANSPRYTPFYRVM